MGGCAYKRKSPQGKNLKRQLYHLPGGTKKVVNTKSVTVVEEVVKQLCRELNVRSPLEQQEFSLCLIVEQDSAMQILSNDEYVLDVTTELEKNNIEHFMLLKRIVWIHPLRKDNQLYVDMMFYQVLPDYLEGLLTIMRSPDSIGAATMDDITTLAALLACSDEERDKQFLSVNVINDYLPKCVQSVRPMTPEIWTDRINKKMASIPPGVTAQSARANFLDILQRWPLFGSIFLYIAEVTDPKVKGQSLLALNKHGLHILDPMIHTSILDVRWTQILTTQKLPNDQSELGSVELFYQGMHHQQSIILRTNQENEIIRLIDQYIYVDSQTNGILARN